MRWRLFSSFPARQFSLSRHAPLEKWLVLDFFGGAAPWDLVHLTGGACLGRTCCCDCTYGADGGVP
ncbi:hypothetical protein N8912_00245 [Rhodobacteraceae bacterium]|nr:hypothetical protein [Paracoccaceae bacterium]